MLLCELGNKYTINSPDIQKENTKVVFSYVTKLSLIEILMKWHKTTQYLSSCILSSSGDTKWYELCHFSV